MDLEWTPEQKQLFEEYRRFGAEQVAPRAADLQAANDFDHESWQLLAEKTEFWLSILPKRFSGREPNWWDFAASLEGLASGCGDGGFILSAAAQAGIIRGLSLLGSESQQERYFPMLRRGALTATCIAEPHSGTDLGALQTQVTGEIGNWKLNGKKWNISHAPTAELLLVVGRMPELGKRDITLFLLDPDHAEIQRGDPEEKLGNRSIPTSWLSFEDLPLRGDEILGEAGEGLKALAPIMAIDRIFYGWMGAMLLRPALERARDFVRERQSMGRPLKDHQYVQQKVAETLIAVEQARWTGMGALSQALTGEPGAAMSSSIAKLAGTRALVQGSRELLSLFGSEGYKVGPVARLAADALGFLNVGGTEESHKINVFRQWLGKK